MRKINDNYKDNDKKIEIVFVLFTIH